MPYSPSHVILLSRDMLCKTSQSNANMILNAWLHIFNVGITLQHLLLKLL